MSSYKQIIGSKLPWLEGQSLLRGTAEKSLLFGISLDFDKEGIGSNTHSDDLSPSIWGGVVYGVDIFNLPHKTH